MSRKTAWVSAQDPGTVSLNSGTEASEPDDNGGRRRGKRQEEKKRKKARRCWVLTLYSSLPPCFLLISDGKDLRNLWKNSLCVNQINSSYASLLTAIPTVS